MKSIIAITLLTSVLLAGSGCSTTSSTKSSALKTSGAVNLQSYEIATVVPFTGSPQSDPGVSQRFAGDIASRLKSDFGPLFKEVQTKDAAAGSAKELVVTGHIREYKPGNRFGRAMFIGVAPAVFKADLILKDGITGQNLMSASIDKLWAWGGVIGASKGIEEMLAESAAASARTVAEGKGWTAKTK